MRHWRTTVGACLLLAAPLAANAGQAASGTATSSGPGTEEPVSVRSLLELARHRADAEDLAGAAAALRRALTAAPSSEELLSTYARISLAARQPAPAVLALEPLTRMHSRVPEYPYLLGVAWMQLGDMAAAVESLERAVALDPGRALAHVALGMALNQQKRYGQAREALEEALRLAPDDLEGLAALAETEEGLGELAAAERRARRVLERDPDHPTTLLVLGMVEMKQGRYAEARQKLEAALAANPGSAKAHYQLSLACSRLGDRQCSARHLESYRQALEDVQRRLRELRGGTEPAGGPPG